MKPFFERQMGNGYIKIVGRNHILPPLGIENAFIMQNKSKTTRAC
jgi:hypothetical protein